MSKSGTTLFTLTDEMAVIFEMIAEKEGELDVQTALALDAVEKQFQGKVDAYARLISECEVRAEAIDREATAMKARASAMSKAADNLKARAMECLRRLGLKSIKGDVYTIRRQNNGGKLPLTVLNEDLAAWPESFLTYPAPILDQQAIRDAFERGEPPLDKAKKPLAQLEPRGEHVRIGL